MEIVTEDVVSVSDRIKALLPTRKYMEVQTEEVRRAANFKKRKHLWDSKVADFRASVAWRFMLVTTGKEYVEKGWLKRVRGGFKLLEPFPRRGEWWLQAVEELVKKAGGKYAKWKTAKVGAKCLIFKPRMFDRWDWSDIHEGMKKKR